MFPVSRNDACRTRLEPVDGCCWKEMIRPESSVGPGTCPNSGRAWAVTTLTSPACDGGTLLKTTPAYRPPGRDPGEALIVTRTSWLAPAANDRLCGETVTASPGEG